MGILTTPSYSLPDSIADRLSGLGIEPERLAEIAEVSRSTAYRWLAGKSVPYDKTIAKIADGTQVSQRWLKTGEGTRVPTEHIKPVAQGIDSGRGMTLLSSETNKLLEHLDLHELIHYAVPVASAGDGVSEDERAPLAVAEIVRTREELRHTTGLDPATLRPVFVYGNSMVPEIQPQSWVFIQPRANIGPPGIYVLNIGGESICKLVDVLTGGVLRISARNRTDFPDDELLEPLPDADTPNMYRSLTTGHSNALKVEGRVVSYTKTA